ncbi:MULTISPECIES: cobyrinate a,c-diamide synthase [Leptolyngbya]|jgi:cobyrinic acid a,c-diamide synthase|uniref:Cobyrinate a,c-diamide synthase n=1 Tax=Leptolyngbya boryana NIES-2135 TaxID=1973484 RepID=A0A1Z4JEM7_LEPBY|nr:MULTISPECIES: cobyrinate a,c-diamide synthase [Leptolyngbya]BAY55201.1 cobyrinic acid a,c-diamide synthase [Leptolyngbya boryana NIES-2135]MBD2369288.1 cobyrinate a,c-diamide synthase [Leptolyngbya sp. FACHB-161]MBD2375710.1 cobyrinate a,c-diamide synthase [Leptolyngbya sp. FACHB-238]MBD2401059.1 cobyrinate a,c-diamide synthase [Leptolyngbya sp. FACHB-239]MBD2406644.1 cobyrinate a,c-diamide synthase [Leptolyngbya sp. FACHB-402]
MAFVIAGERSGAGKTTVTLALLAALRRRNLTVRSFKVGPDYIDPMFHRHVTGQACYNLDPVLTSEAYVQQCFAQRASEYSIVEGVMGLFDGAAGHKDFASTAHIARLLDLPILLVVDCRSLSYSVAAIVHGYRSLDPRLKFAGVVLNRVGSDRHLELLKSALIDVPILGVLRRQDAIEIPDRHLGLVPTDELPGLTELIDRLAELGESCFDWDALMPYLKTATTPKVSVPESSRSVKIAIARDAAFNFYYQDNLDLLRQAGAELIEWSPLRDTFPNDVDGLYFGGGFPEMFAETLSENHATRHAIRAAIQSGMPTYAECGGLMYLSEKIIDFSEQAFSMVGAIPTTTVMRSRLTLGYRKATALQTTPIVKKDETLHGHEFHRSSPTTESEKPLFELTGLSRSSMQYDGWQTPKLHASYLHLHWGATSQIPQRFVRYCTKFRSDRYP